MKTVILPSGERIPAFGQGTWNMSDNRALRAAEIAALRLKENLHALELLPDAAQLAELDSLFPPPPGPQPLAMLWDYFFLGRVLSG